VAEARLYQQHTGTLQFVLLALMFALPLFHNQILQLISQEQLADILVLELGVLIYGFFIAGLFLLPLALIDNIWFRRISLFFAFLLAINISSFYSEDYGFYGTLFFIGLLFVNYGAVFTSNSDLAKRGRLAIEIGLRNIIYIVVFLTLATILDMPTSAGYSWHGRENLLTFGFIYFSISAFIEFKRYFPVSANTIYHFLNNNYVRLPKSRVRYKYGKLKAYVIKYSNAHYWWFNFIIGFVLVAFTSVIFFAINADTESSWLFKIFVWLFLSIFFLSGIALLLNAPTMAYRIISAKPTLLAFDKNSLRLTSSKQRMGCTTYGIYRSISPK